MAGIESCTPVKSRANSRGQDAGSGATRVVHARPGGAARGRLPGGAALETIAARRADPAGLAHPGSLLLLVVLLVSLGLGLPGAARGESASGAPGPAADGRPYVVKIYAEWCGICHMLEPTWQRIEKELGGDARLVVFDVTDRQAVAASRAEAERLGLTRIFDRLKHQTGTIAVLDGKGEPVEVMRGLLEFAEYERAVAEAAARS